MTLISCSRRLHFCAGHRVYGHENKCAHLHGHNYVVWLKAEADLDSIGRVIDFSILKERIGGWINRHWDHGTILWHSDPLVAVLDKHEQKHYVMPTNPTAENMAAYLLDTICPTLMPEGVRVVSVEIYETENCVAEARR